MANGAQGGLSGVLFEAGKAISDAGKQQAQQTAQTVFSSVTGSQKQLFSKPQGSSAPLKPAGGQLPNMNGLGDLGNFGKLLENGKGTSGTQTSMPANNQMSQQQLATMAAQNQKDDQARIAQVEAELTQLKQQLHNENYYNAIKNAGKTMAQERQENAQRVQQEEAERQQKEQANAGAVNSLSGDMFRGSAQLGTPVAVQQAKTQTEANRGTTG